MAIGRTPTSDGGNKPVRSALRWYNQTAMFCSFRGENGIRSRPAAGSNRHQFAGAAFTLIELLVVIAIIALLVGILVPTVLAARQLAKRSFCLSQQRSVGIAWQMYLEDSSEFFPPWASNIDWFYGGKEPSIVKSYTINYRPLNPYVGRAIKSEAAADVFHCPSDWGLRYPTGKSRISDYSCFDYYGNSFLMNSSLLDARSPKTGLPTGKPFRRTMVEVAHSSLVLAGDCQWYLTANDTTWDARWHGQNDRTNIVFLDGHAKYTDILRDSDSGGDYTFWPYRELPESGQ